MSLLRHSLSKVIESSGATIKPLGPLTYGTAGFRLNYESYPTNLRQIVIYSTVIACLRSASEGNKWVGIIITASHNKIQDNGLKIIDISGSMLNIEFEKISSDVMNSECPLTKLDKYYEEFKLRNINLDLNKAHILIGYDTRPSSPELVGYIKDTLDNLGVDNYYEFGYVTTPQLHFIVALANGTLNELLPIETPNIWSYLDDFNQKIVEDSLALYYAYHEYYFKLFVENITQSEILYTIQDNSYNSNGRFLVDVANGVAKYHIGRYSECLKLTANICMEQINDDNPELLNDQCGSEYIQKNKIAPINFYDNENFDIADIDYVASFDGDADRIVYFTKKKNNPEIILIDGDRLAAIYINVITTLFRKIISNINKENCSTLDDTFRLKVGAVQTAYANSSSTLYISELLNSLDKDFFESEVTCVPTGVKHLHRKAESYEVAIYFESNGHGTVIYNRKELILWAEKLRKLYLSNCNCRYDHPSHMKCSECSTLKQLFCFLNIFNPAIGDGMSDLLAFEASRIFIQGTYGCQFAVQMYHDLVTVQDKIPLPRSKLDTLVCDKQTEKFLIQPTELQEKIDNLVNYNNNLCRAFIRPSGTEDICRLFVESPNQEQSMEIMNSLKQLLHDFSSIHES
ncbi:phosphoacetyl glucosamine mutase [Cryptosporidium andersoni]|uniref:Phosphoacetyl glucosamine mutase n=1 Tax=Cryptosporidium andersoni TaxID=117008 RepID=A0A1J4MTW4_9CRYT|nr:phosphoacetyl glucosamine mutase [Cryptosporidium andersoni]